MKYLISFMILIVMGGCSNPFKKEKEPANMDLYLLIGQSNMAGRAAIEPQDLDTLSNVFLFKGDREVQWEKAANPLNKYSTIRKELTMQKLSLAYTFAKEMAESSGGKKVGLIVNARGGTSINLWAPGSEYYLEAARRTKEAMKFGTLKGIAWHQGESDVSKSDSYTPKIKALINAFRSEFGLSDLPFVLAQLSEDKPTRKVFNQMIFHLPEKIHNVSVVSTENTGTFDKTHFDSESQRILGKRYAQAMMKLVSK